MRAFTVAGSKAQDVAKQIKDALAGGKEGSTIKINEVKFVAADPLTGDVSIAAQIAAQTLGPEFKQWLNDPQKLLQLIAAAEGAKSGGLEQPRECRWYRWEALRILVPGKVEAEAEVAGGRGRAEVEEPAVELPEVAVEPEPEAEVGPAQADRAAVARAQGSHRRGRVRLFPFRNRK